jgi:hypothetical protein
MYLDKLDGHITQEFFDKHSATWLREPNGLLRKIQDIQKATPAPIDQAVDMLRLTSRASELFGGHGVTSCAFLWLEPPSGSGSLRLRRGLAVLL